MNSHLRSIGCVTATLFLVALLPAQTAASGQTLSPTTLTLHAERTSSRDLEVGGELAGAPGSTRYITRDDLLALPQTTFVVKNDANFTGPTEVSGVLLEELIRQLGTAPKSDMLVAVCDDQYRANYPQAYIAAHQPLLVLKSEWTAACGVAERCGRSRPEYGPVYDFASQVSSQL